MCLDCKLGASVQNCVVCSMYAEYVGADGYASACVNCTTCLLLRSLLFITRLYLLCLGAEEKRRGGKTTSGNGQAWSSANPRG